jgi:protein SCO1/2
MRLNGVHWIFVGAVVGGGFLLSQGITYYQTTIAALPVYGPMEIKNGVSIPHTIPDFILIAEDGGPFSSNVLDGKVCVVNFFFTSCPSICPKMMRNVQSVHELYRLDDDVLFLSITVDPDHDTPQRLSKYAELLNAETAQWKFLTGEKKAIYALARNAYFLSASEGDGGPHDFIHSENLALIDGKRQIRGYYNGLDKESVGQLSKDIAKLKRKNP